MEMTPNRRWGVLVIGVSELYYTLLKYLYYMKEKLKKVIDKIIIPHYPIKIDYTIKVESKDIRYNIVFYSPIDKKIETYIVTYFFPDKETAMKYYLKISEETEGLFDMLGPDAEQKIEVGGHYPDDTWSF